MKQIGSHWQKSGYKISKNHEPRPQIPKDKFLKKQNLIKGSLGGIKVNRKVWIVQGQVVKMDRQYVYVAFDQHLGICPWKNISDYHKRWVNLIHEQGIYSFLVIKLVQNNLPLFPNDNRLLWLLSYKSVHPEEIANKNKPVPTSSHFLTLNKIFKTQKTNPYNPLPFQNYWNIANKIRINLTKEYLTTSHLNKNTPNPKKSKLKKNNFN